MARINDNAAWFTDPAGNNVKAPDSIEYYTQQYKDQANNNGFKRPAIFIEFGEVRMEARSGLSKKAIIPISVHVVQDTYIKGRQGQPVSQAAAFKDLLNYPYIVNSLLDGWSGTCFNKLVFTGAEPDHDVDNLYIEVLKYTCEANVKRAADVP